MGSFLSTDTSPKKLRTESRNCPDCQENGIITKIDINKVFISTQMGSLPFYYSGVYHYHDGNISYGTWSCPNGHSGQCIKSGGRCPNCNDGYLKIESINHTTGLDHEEESEK